MGYLNAEAEVSRTSTVCEDFTLVFTDKTGKLIQFYRRILTYCKQVQFHHIRITNYDN